MKIDPITPHEEKDFFTPEEYACYYAIMLEESNINLQEIKDDKLVISEMERYANAGMEILLKEILGEYCSKDLKLDPSTLKELPKAILYYIYEKLH